MSLIKKLYFCYLNRYNKLSLLQEAKVMPHPSRKTVIISTLTALFMFGLTFAFAPLYSALCKKTGLNTSIPDPSLKTNFSRDILVQFVAENNSELPWSFYPKVTSIHVHPEQNTKIFFVAKNNSANTMTVQAIPSFAPQQSGQYVHKIECFCFRQQTLKSHESVEMPVVFRIDDKLPADVNTITLAYTLFDTSNEKGNVNDQEKISSR
jgi:cytochrome c oxidase assembly protein subunit 11